MNIPVLETERLLLRGFCETDLDDVAAIFSDEQVTRHLVLTAKPVDKEGSHSIIVRALDQWRSQGFGPWAAEERSTGSVIGRIGLNYLEGWPAGEVGWTLGRNWWGQGYATEGARAAMKYAFEILSWTDIVSVIHPKNTRSIAVAARLGHELRHTWERDGIELLIYGQKNPTL